MTNPKGYEGTIEASFTFEGDDRQLARDHFEMLVKNLLVEQGWKVKVVDVRRDWSYDPSKKAAEGSPR